MTTDLSARVPDISEMVASSGISIRLWRLYAQAWLVCLFFPILYLVQTPQSPIRLFVAVAGLVIFVFTYTWYMWPHPLRDVAHRPTRFRAALAILMGLTALILLLVGLYGSTFLWLLVGLSAIAGIALPATLAFITIMALTLVTLGLGIRLSGGVFQVDWLHLIPLVLLVRGLGLDLAGVARLSVALRELHTARSELARRAVAEERLRLARDLHDLLGHTLSLITLKSELAGRLIEKEPVRAAQEIREVENVARQALREVREAVAGYRQPTLLTEIGGAREMLAAAGINCTIEQSTQVLPSAIDTVIAWTIREGVTNVIRHSRARYCIIKISTTDSQVWAEVLNDGCQEPDLTSLTNGNGLSGLTERVAGAGGHLEAGPMLSDKTQCFRLRVEFPTGDAKRNPSL